MKALAVLLLGIAVLLIIGLMLIFITYIPLHFAILSVLMVIGIPICLWIAMGILLNIEMAKGLF